MADASLSSRVYDDILGRILSGRMKPGDVFNRRQVAAELGVSVAPVLEAMLELETEGLIQTLPRRGTRVRLPDARDVWGHAVVREAIESQAARIYCGAPVLRHQSRLLRLAEALDALPAGSVDQIRQEIRFHHYLVALAACEPLTRAFERIMKLGLLHAAALLEGEQSLLPSHVALVEALLTSDPDAAQNAIRAHLHNLRAPHAATESPVGDEAPALPNWLSETV
ncbi:GntR family transcriptional regulator [Humisphaera borealis]|uniref:GntR family transcriptional regulator n=1 Tax=Humisphaera borealis TaxID=2807512 RepID=A0A7M2X282_9BACT|nr:GntR family transcriptional regulator [Humisphaera borealis]QOV91805.1 GntR family transcriptional regulator [Humisphaera borealis]